MPNKSRLKKEGFILAHILRAQSFASGKAWWQACAIVITLCPQSGRRDEHWYSTSLFLWDDVTIIYSGLTSSAKPSWKYLQRHQEVYFHGVSKPDYLKRCRKISLAELNMHLWIKTPLWIDGNSLCWGREIRILGWASQWVEEQETAFS